jgi:hypothetical protein
VTRDELEHAIRAACDVSRQDELIVIGSQSILGQFPDAPAALRQSVEVDVVVPVANPDAADLIDGVLGERSRFHDTHGFYVHGLTLDAATLPAGWESRLIPVRPDPLRQWVGNCLQGNDLAASKLAAFRDKDRDFVRVLLAERMLDGSDVVERLRLLPIDAAAMERRVRWVNLTLRDLRLPANP